jgi:hypothetical protein
MLFVVAGRPRVCGGHEPCASPTGEDSSGQLPQPQHVVQQYHLVTWHPHQLCKQQAAVQGGTPAQQEVGIITLGGYFKLLQHLDRPFASCFVSGSLWDQQDLPLSSGI